MNSVAAAKTSKLAYESIALFYLQEMLVIMEQLAKSQIIHGDIKADNFLLLSL